jgi:hypothetical protein
MRNRINKELLTKTLNVKIKNIKSMTWDELSNWMQVVAAIVGAITFLALIATVWVTLKANTEKDAKAREQQERIQQISLKVEEEARKRAEAERALLELQERLAPRKLTENEIASLVKVLSKQPNGVFISCKLLDQESCGFAEILASVFRRSGWEVIVNKTSLNSFSGFTVFANTAAETLLGLDAILLAFKEARISHRTNRLPEGSIGQFPGETLFIVVGTK